MEQTLGLPQGMPTDWSGDRQAEVRDHLGHRQGVQAKRSVLDSIGGEFKISRGSEIGHFGGLGGPGAPETLPKGGGLRHLFQWVLR